MKRTKVLYKIIVLLLCSILFFLTGCKNSTKVASETLATKSIIQNNNTREESKTKKPSILLFLFNRKEYNRQLEEENNKIEETIEIIKETENIQGLDEEEPLIDISLNIDIATISTISNIEKNNKVIPKSTISSVLIASTLSEVSEIIDIKNEEIATISQPEEIKYEKKDYIETIFKSPNDKIKIKTFINDLNNRNYNKIYNDCIRGEYKETVNNFVNDYVDIFNDLKVELSKEKYKNFIESFNKRIKNQKFKDFNNDFNKLIKKHNESYDEIINLFNRLSIRTLIINTNKGKYVSFFNDIKDLLMKEKYKEQKEEILNEFIDGEYTEITYNFVYYFLETTYNYGINESIEIEEIEETIETPTETETQEAVEELTVNTKREFPIILVAGLIIIILLIITISYISLNKRKGENQNEQL